MDYYHLVKVTELKYAQALQDGKVFMGKLSNFADMEKRSSEMKNCFRGDVLEGVTAIFDKDHPHPFFEEAFGIDAWEQIEVAGFIDASKWQQKIFCLYCLEFDDKECKYVKPNPQIIDFGDTAVIITDPIEFLQRVVYKLHDIYRDALWVAFKRVGYNINMTQYGFYDEFSKSTSYSWQNEFRISVDLSQGKMSEEQWKQSTEFARLTSGLVLYDDPGDLLIDIGDIRDISTLVDIEDFIRLDFQGKRLPIPKYIEPFTPPTECRMTLYRPFVKFKK